MFLTLLLSIPILVICTNDGNIHLLEEEIASAIHSCSLDIPKTRQRRSEESRIDGNTRQDTNQYYHERRSGQNQMHVLNGTDYDYMGYGEGDVGEKFIKTLPRPALSNNGTNNSDNALYRNKRSNSLIRQSGTDQCLSQCVFANLQVVDAKGIPRETQLWNKIQTSVNSQQSRTLIRDQLRACFLELESETEDNGCSYSNKLERCLMLQLTDRNTDKIKQSNETSPV
ncbi:unnamed protein product [Leptosia nina]|uniref:Uncharacterized protein n=1 Tax=Leptosia nina TaxID=320188 RepID=A0AAV1JUS3_9NEOP